MKTTAISMETSNKCKEWDFWNINKYTGLLKAIFERWRVLQSSRITGATCHFIIHVSSLNKSNAHALECRKGGNPPPAY